MDAANREKKQQRTESVNMQLGIGMANKLYENTLNIYAYLSR